MDMLRGRGSRFEGGPVAFISLRRQYRAATACGVLGQTTVSAERVQTAGDKAVMFRNSTASLEALA